MPPPASAFNTFLSDTHDAMDKPKLLDRVHAVARLCHLSLGTERAYSGQYGRDRGEEPGEQRVARVV